MSRRSTKRRRKRHTPRYIIYIKKLGTPIRIGWNWLLIYALAYVAHQWIGLPDFTTGLSAIYPATLLFRRWRKWL